MDCRTTIETSNRHRGHPRRRGTLQHGCPKRIITDNGRQFESREFHDLLAKSGIEHRKTPPYSPQCNPVERGNRTLKTMIAQYVGANHRKWDLKLPQLVFAANTAIHDSTGYTPVMLTYGREISPPGSLRARLEPTLEAGIETTLQVASHLRQLEPVLGSRHACALSKR